MVLDYIPCDVDVFSSFYKEYKKLKKLTKDDANKLFWNLLDKSFCKCIIARGKNKGLLCMKRIRSDFVDDGYTYCRSHRYQETECNIETCNKKRKKGYKVCSKHYKMKTKIEEFIDKNKFYKLEKDEEEIMEKDEEEIKLLKNIDLYTKFDYYHKIDNYICFYPNMNIFKIKIKDNIAFPKYKYENQHIIKYNNFCIKKFLYNIFINFKNMINAFIKRYNINIIFLYYLLDLIKKINEKHYSKDIILYKNKFVFNEIIYEYIDYEKYKRLYEYIHKIYNTNYTILLKILYNEKKKIKKVPEIENLSNNYYNYIKEIIKIEYNMLNNYYYTSSNIFEIKINDIEIVRRDIPNLVCYNPLKQSPNERKEKKRIQKFNNKYKKLLKINEETFIWIDKTLKTELYKNKAKYIIIEQMIYLDKIIEIHGKDINFIRNTYKSIYSYLCDSWEFISRDDSFEKHDFKIVYNSDNWKKYGSHENDEYKRLFKI